MYAAQHAQTRPAQPCLFMAASGEVITYGEFEGRANRLAHLLLGHGLERLDHYSIFMENNAYYAETCAAGERWLRAGFPAPAWGAAALASRSPSGRPNRFIGAL